MPFFLKIKRLLRCRLNKGQNVTILSCLYSAENCTALYCNIVGSEQPLKNPGLIFEDRPTWADKGFLLKQNFYISNSPFACHGFYVLIWGKTYCNSLLKSLLVQTVVSLLTLQQSYIKKKQLLFNSTTNSLFLLSSQIWMHYVKNSLSVKLFHKNKSGRTQTSSQ